MMLVTKEILERRKKFVSVLRSGEYEQVKGRLRVGDTYCCLGVACDVFRKETGQGHWFNDKFFWQTINETHIPPEGVMTWLGHKTENPDLFATPDKEMPGKLYIEGMTQANDKYGWTFAQIADLYERRYITPFEPEVEEIDDATE